MRHALLCCVLDAHQGLRGVQLLALLVLLEIVHGSKVELEGVVQSSHLGCHGGRVAAAREDMICQSGDCMHSHQNIVPLDKHSVY